MLHNEIVNLCELPTYPLGKNQATTAPQFSASPEYVILAALLCGSSVHARQGDLSGKVFAGKGQSCCTEGSLYHHGTFRGGLPTDDAIRICLQGSSGLMSWAQLGVL